MEYYLGAYYLIKLNNNKNKIYSCSSEINKSYLDIWSYSWTSLNENTLKNAILEFNIDGKLLNEIQIWVNEKFENKKIGWINTFNNLETLIEYKNRFFPNETDLEILSINFPKSECNMFLKIFEQKYEDIGVIGILENLKKRISENINHEYLGLDIVGIEIDGSLMSFYNQFLSELTTNHKLKINKYGLIEGNGKLKSIIEHLNKIETEDLLPWFYVKVRRVK